jgi:hypothetical protein
VLATQRLLRNQQDIGDAIKPFYGRAADERLTSLLKEHILFAGDLVAAAKAGDQSAVQRHSAAWCSVPRAVQVAEEPSAAIERRASRRVARV